VGGSALRRVLVIGQPLVVAQPDGCRIGIRQWQPAAGSAGRGPWLRWAMTAAATRSAVLWRSFRTIAQRGQDQRCRAHQPEEVHSGNHQHQLSVA
jgi:hypothetical protein